MKQEEEEEEEESEAEAEAEESEVKDKSSYYWFQGSIPLSRSGFYKVLK